MLGLAFAVACGETPAADDAREPEVRVRVGHVGLDANDAPVVLLAEESGPRVLPIWIGSAEATSIALQLEGRRSPRPNFHDLVQSVIQRLDARVERVVVTELRDGTYYAVLRLSSHGRMVEIDVRPSDAIAVALRSEAPILVRASVFDEAAQTLADETPQQEISGPRTPGRPPATELRKL